MTYDANDKAKVRMAKKDAKSLQEKMDAGLRKILNDKDSRFFLQVLLTETGWDGDCNDQVQEGKARIGRAIVKRMLSLEPGIFTIFTQEEQNGNKPNDGTNDDFIFI